MRHRLLAAAAAVLLGACGDSEPLSTEVESSSSTERTTTSLPPAVEPPVADALPLDDPEALADALPDPDTAREVLARTPPEPPGPPADLQAGALELTTMIEADPGAEPLEAGDRLVAHYVGVLADGTVFDESWSREQPFEVTIGGGQVIPGWDEGLVGVRPGERVRLEIGSDLAYGPQGNGPIPPNSPLAFEIDVIGIIRAG